MSVNKSFQVTSGVFNCTEVTLCSKDATEFFEFVKQRALLAPAVFKNVNFSLSLAQLQFKSEGDASDLIREFGIQLQSMGHRLVGVTDTKPDIAKRSGVQFLTRPKPDDNEPPSMSSGLTAKPKQSDTAEIESKIDLEAAKPQVIEKIVEVERIVEVEKIVEVHAADAVSSIDNTKIVKGPIRGGQQVYAEGQNLLILGDVKRGARVSADGSITVFGKLNGSANAGHKSKESSIIATNFDPEIVSVNGIFYTQEQLDFKEKDGTVIIYLNPNTDTLVMHAGGKI